MSTKKLDQKHSLSGTEIPRKVSKIDPPDLIKKSNTEKMEHSPKDKPPKPEELKNFDALSHFKENIIHFYKNCSEPIKDYSFYCFTCKHSVCSDCGLYEHKEHLLIQRDNCLNYDNSFFNDISKIIEDGLNLDSRKSQIKQDISKSINQLKEELDIIEKNKLEENIKNLNNKRKNKTNYHYINKVVKNSKALSPFLVPLNNN